MKWWSGAEGGGSHQHAQLVEARHRDRLERVAARERRERRLGHAVPCQQLCVEGFVNERER